MICDILVFSSKVMFYILPCMHVMCQQGAAATSTPFPSIRACKHSLQLAAGVFATAGLRGDDRMEDRHVIREDLEGQAGCHLLAVFDGHRGPQAAQYAAHHILQVLQDQLATGTPAQALTNTFVSVDGSFR